MGEFYAKTLARIMNGASPRRLIQVFEDPSQIAINLTTAERIKFYPTMDNLSIADEIYRTPAVPPE